MTREEARKAAEVMLAYADGKEIEQHWGELWVINKEPKFDWGYTDYRIKPFPTYRPFKDAKECWNEMQKHQPFGWITHKATMEYEMITCLNRENDTVNVSSMLFLMNDIFQHYTFADGSVFGVKEE